MKIDSRVDCNECAFNGKEIDCDAAMIKWLHEEYVEGGKG